MKDAGINFETYKHPLTKPLSYEGTTFEVLEFDWTILTGQDSLAIEAELAKKQKTFCLPSAGFPPLCYYSVIRFDPLPQLPQRAVQPPENICVVVLSSRARSPQPRTSWPT